MSQKFILLSFFFLEIHNHINDHENDDTWPTKIQELDFIFLSSI